MKPARKVSPDPDAGYNPKVQRAYNLRPTRIRKSLEMRRGRLNIFPACQTARVLSLEEDRGPEAWFSGDLLPPGADRVSPRLVATSTCVPGLRDPWAHRADPGPTLDLAVSHAACRTLGYPLLTLPR